jgi:CheY-like chemotaxis protein
VRLLLDGEPARPGYSGRGSGMRILVVDDEPSVAQVIAEAVQARGDAALVCLDATEALELLETTKVDGVFMDLVMPGLGGLAALARIRSRHPKLPVVILSGHADEDQVKEALKLGAVEVVRKPAALTHLTEALARLEQGG